jgi:hypothetical protein
MCARAMAGGGFPLQPARVDRWGMDSCLLLEFDLLAPVDCVGGTGSLPNPHVTSVGNLWRATRALTSVL